jgi:vacuolar-type H+-ATPase subunit H
MTGISMSIQRLAMKNDKAKSCKEADEAIQQVLQAERDAEQAIRDCETEAVQIINAARNRAQRINSRVDQRITNLEMRHDHKLDRTIKNIERDGAVELRLDASRQYDPDVLQTVIDALAIELCQSSPAAED